MNSHLPAPESAPPPRRNWTRRLVNLLVALVVVAVAAATFVFSYSGVHAIALFGGVSAQLARYYPGLFDAVLVIACVAAVVLRDGRWWARLWAWLVIVVLLAAIAVTDVLHAMNYALRPRLTEGIVAAAPVAAVLLAFSLLLTMLRQSRLQPPHGAGPAGLPGGRTRGAGGQPAPATLEIPSLPAAEASTVEIPALGPSPQLRKPAPPIALPAAFTPPPPAAETAVPMPAPAVDGAARTAADKAANSVPDEAADTAPNEAANTVPDIAPTREEPVIAGQPQPEPPTVLTPAAAEAPAVPAAPPAPEAPGALTPTAAEAPAMPVARAVPEAPGALTPTAAEAPAVAAARSVPEAPSVPQPPAVPEVPAVAEADQPAAGPAEAPDATSDAGAALPSGTAATAPSDTAPPGTAPSGASPPGTAPPGTTPSDTSPSGTAPSGAPEPATAPVPVPARKPAGIRYAGGAAPRSGSAADYWDAEEASPYAGQVYPAHDEHADAGAGERADGNGHDADKGDKGGDDDSARDKQPSRRLPPELDDDAPPFATAPFAPVPRLNRVRSMPVPPADDEE